ncbi:uncharacterized protein LOC101848287 [Aplysia californica]|uniref:Uncharacterized protein LOC101848287 n=1 Tax=Aplysia californica TaxID=6500 RepID=A0ABM0JLR6_APLCA|nr:uncharacterized protein LOC101848287 [Aplysia californica]
MLSLQKVLFHTCWLLFCVFGLANSAQDASSTNLGFSSLNSNSSSEPGEGPPLVLSVVSNMGRPHVLLFTLEVNVEFKATYSVFCSSPEDVYIVQAKSAKPSIAEFLGNTMFNVSCELSRAYFENSPDVAEKMINSTLEASETENNEPVNFPEQVSYNTSTSVATITGTAIFKLKTNNIGRTFVMFFAFRKDGPIFQNSTRSPKKMEAQNTGNVASPSLPPNVVGKGVIIVMQLPRAIDKIFRTLLYIVIVTATIGMGMNVEIDIVKTVMKKPVAPIIGMFCQYICMPLIAYTVAKTIPQDNAAVSLGIFACGVVPGGGASNFLTYLLNGDVSLSVTMTGLSSIASLGMIPLWMLTLGETFEDENISLHIPFINIAETLSLVLLPLFVGLLLKIKCPRITAVVVKILKPALFIVVAFVLSVGIYANMHIFKMIKPMVVIAACALPYVGFLLGAVSALIFRQSWARVKTIAIETGIQNMAIAFIMLYLAIPPPDNQLASVAPAASSIMTQIPPLITVIIYTIYNRYKNKNKPPSDGDDKADDDCTICENGVEKNDVKSEINGVKSEKNGVMKVKDNDKAKEEGKGSSSSMAQTFLEKLMGREHVKSPADEALNQEIVVKTPEEEKLMKKNVDSSSV